MARVFVPDDYDTPPLQTDEQADALGWQNDQALESIRQALGEQILLSGLCAEYFEHRDLEAFAGALTVQVSCANAFEIISSTAPGRTVAVPRSREGPSDDA